MSLRLSPISVVCAGHCILLTAVVVLSTDVCYARGPAAAPRINVALVLLDAPSSLGTTTDPASLETLITSSSQLTEGGTVFLEAWCQTPGPNGISTAVVDLTYETTFFTTSVAQISLAPQWGTLPYTVSVNDAAGLVDDLGGNNLSGLGVAPNWARIGTVQLDVTGIPSDPVVFCSLFAGGILQFAIVGEGSVSPIDVVYGCATLSDP